MILSFTDIFHSFIEMYSKSSDANAWFEMCYFFEWEKLNINISEETMIRTVQFSAVISKPFLYRTNRTYYNLKTMLQTTLTTSSAGGASKCVDLQVGNG